jgi:ComF family protein
MGNWPALLIDLLIPPRCLLCAVPVPRGGGLCADCWGRLSFLGPPLCQRCGLPFEVEGVEASLCGACLVAPPRFRRARSVLRYDRVAKDLILGFKYADRTGRSPHFALWMARAGQDLLDQTDLIVPVPLHPWRLFRRGYNQAALLANGLARQAGRTCCPDALARVRNTVRQGHLGRQDRRANLHGVIRMARPDVVDGRRVLLVDDVFTTGATVGECAQVLLSGGAVAVDVLTLARVVRPGAAAG